MKELYPTLREVMLAIPQQVNYFKECMSSPNPLDTVKSVAGIGSQVATFFNLKVRRPLLVSILLVGTSIFFVARLPGEINNAQEELSQVAPNMTACGTRHKSDPLAAIKCGPVTHTNAAVDSYLTLRWMVLAGALLVVALSIWAVSAMPRRPKKSSLATVLRGPRAKAKWREVRFRRLKRARYSALPAFLRTLGAAMMLLMAGGTVAGTLGSALAVVLATFVAASSIPGLSMVIVYAHMAVAVGALVVSFVTFALALPEDLEELGV